MKRYLPWIITVALLGAAWMVAFAAPKDDMTLTPFTVTTQMDEEVVARDFALTVHDIRAARTATAPNDWRAEGTWLLVDLEAEATLTQEGTLLNGATLTIGERTIRASERMPSMMEHRLVPGIPYRGTLAFELPDGALTGTGILRLSTNDDTRGDSVAEMRIDLDSLNIEDVAAIHDTEWGRG
ncbi:hypothetical protein DC31_07960 [Microbacterium sp. CH12i]|uniref:hypothetical protein n=1 Tax=Microbacterium sp. CH12i TaxID=1479651 RepID=UPI000461305E|nr:hypothetical protein [Microbacterium sp. CH12i]KDA06892.1 hypothetical protein DC31_07960 [Microbacterium sp. CH12i]